MPLCCILEIKKAAVEHKENTFCFGMIGKKEYLNREWETLNFQDLLIY